MLASAHESHRLYRVVKDLVADLGSQSAAGRAAGLSQSYVSRIGKGMRDDSRVQRSSLTSVESRLGLPANFFSSNVPVESWRDHVLDPPSIEQPPTERDVRLAMVAAAVGLGHDADPRDILVRVVDLVMEGERG